MANLVPRTLNITGADCTGYGSADSTYALTESGILTAGMTISVNGTVLSSSDFSYSAGTITFLNVIDAADTIRIVYFYSSLAAAGSVTYSSTLSLTMFMGLLGSVPDKDNTSLEEIGKGDNTTLTFWFDKLGVIEDTYTISYGSTASSVTALTEDTHYTVDLDTSKITLTTAGRTAVGSNYIYAEYKYNRAEIVNSDLTLALITAENKVRRDTEVKFADYTVTAPSYIQITNEIKKAQYDPYQKVYDFYHVPIVKIQTTVNGAYTTGGTSIILDDATGLPSSGTIYIGGEKVAYTARSSNTLTIPSSTASIDDAAVVRGEVIELSMEPEGTARDFDVLTPDTEYEMDYDNGRFLLLSNAYWGEIASDDRIYPSNYLIRVSYMSAWHEPSRTPEIPDEIEWVVNALAARRLMGAVVAKAHEIGLDGFNPALINVDREEIREVLQRYQVLNVGTSMFNKQSIS